MYYFYLIFFIVIIAGVVPGQKVEIGQQLAVVEAMKMQVSRMCGCCSCSMVAALL